MKISVLGIDLGKHGFHVHGVDEQGRRVLQKKFSRAKLMEFMGRLEPCLVGLEACGGAHHLARTFQGYGHEVRLMHPRFVKAYVKSNKNDYLDAEAICEAVTRPTMRLVPIKSVAQQDLQSLHRLRSLAVGQRTAQVNQIRGVLLEQGIVVPQGIGALRQQLPLLLEEAENGLTPTFRELLPLLYEELVHVEERIQRFDRLIAAEARQDERCQRLLTIPGIGVLIASALVAAIGDGRQFNNARELAAWLGLVPRQSATGGQIRLLGISKRGDTYLRALLIQGARAVLRTAAKKTDRRSRWVTELMARRGRNVAAVALANKNARTAWAVLTRDTTYQLAAAA